MIKFGDADLKKAIEAGRSRHNSRLHAVSAKYIEERDAVEVHLDNGITVTWPRENIDEFAGMPRDLMKKLTVSPRGAGLDLDAANIHIDLHGLVASMLTPGDMAKYLARDGLPRLIHPQCGEGGGQAPGRRPGPLMISRQSAASDACTIKRLKE